MCFVCQHPNRDNYASINPSLVWMFIIPQGESSRQRQNYEAMKARGPQCPLCPKHLANYEQVVIRLEELELQRGT